MSNDMVGDYRQTWMYREAGEAGEAVARLWAGASAPLRELGAALRADPPAVVVTCARGSSDHAATYLKYLVETLIGIPVASAGLSVASLFDAPAVAGRSLCVAISQSGRSPDLLATVEAQKKGGARVLTLCNDAASPLAALGEPGIALGAGPEHALAATKSFICSLVGALGLVAAWRDDARLLAALESLPDLLNAAWQLDWREGLDMLRDAERLLVLGRGYSFAVAQEAALKFKETCGLHAEAFSAAEVRHGPMAIVGDGFPVLALATSDPAGRTVQETAQELADHGARVVLAGGGLGQGGVTVPQLPLPLACDPVIEPILTIVAVYKAIARLSVERGYNPDRHDRLKKVTATI